MKHHCAARLEIRVVDGYPWAPAEVRLVHDDAYGKVPVALQQQIQTLATSMVQYGTPIVSGWNAVSDAVRKAVEILE